MRRALAAACCAALALGAWPALAHDQWLWPSSFDSSGAARIELRLYVGEDLVAEAEKTVDPTRVLRFQHVYAGGVEELRADGAAMPIARAELGPGSHLFVLDRSHARIELAPEKFHAYLDEEGFAAARAERSRRGEDDKPGRERYERALKALVVVGAGDDSYRRVTGGALELVPETDPTHGGAVRVGARFLGRPIGGLRVELVSHGGAVVKATTGDDGAAVLEVPPRGAHLFRAVHMTRCDGCDDAEWHSFWTTYAFATFEPGAEVPAPPVLPEPARPRRTWLYGALGFLALALAAGFAVRAKRR